MADNPGPQPRISLAERAEQVFRPTTSPKPQPGSAPGGQPLDSESFGQLVGGLVDHTAAIGRRVWRAGRRGVAGVEKKIPLLKRGHADGECTVLQLGPTSPSSSSPDWAAAVFEVDNQYSTALEARLAASGFTLGDKTVLDATFEFKPPAVYIPAKGSAKATVRVTVAAGTKRGRYVGTIDDTNGSFARLPVIVDVQPRPV